MASTIITKNSSTASAVPVVGDLTKGELAVNVTDKKIYTKDNSAAVVKLVGSLGNQEANAVAITGGSIAGITDLAVADGGTGASTASDARTNLGLGTIATQAASSVTITGGSVTGITDITVADGGTGASTAANARTNLGAAASGANSDITSLSGLTTALSVAQGGTGITSFGSGVATFLGTPSSANLLAAVTDETGTGALVFANTPTLVAPILGTPTSGNFSTGTFTWPTFNQNTTGTAAGLSATLAIASGGTGATTAGGALTSLGAYAASNPSGYTSNTGTVTSVGGTGTVNGLTLTGTVTTSGNLTLGGTLSGVSLTSQVSGTLPTANGGTNLTSFTSGGVVYASSTSALATGSALTFDGTNLGVGIASATSLLDVRDGVGSILTLGNTGNFGLGEFSRIKWKEGSTQLADIGWEADNNELRINNRVAYTTFYASNAEAMRLTSTSLYTASGINVGIGTSSLDSRLEINSSASNTARIRIKLNDTPFCYLGGYSGIVGSGNADDLALFAWTGKQLMFGTNATEKMRLDTAGNLGLGGTPKPYLNPNYNALDMHSGRTVLMSSSGTPQTNLQTNAYYDNTDNRFEYSQTGYAASNYAQQGGAHYWYQAASGTAGDAISFSQAMTLSASGGLGVGETSIASDTRLHLKHTTDNCLLKIQSSYSPILRLINGGGSEVSTIDATGNNVLTFQTGSSERARIDSLGNLVVGASSAFDGTYRGIQAINTTGGDCAVFTTTGVTGNVVRWNKATSGDNLFIDFYTETSITNRGGISYNRAGGLTAYNTTSDYRAKDISGPVTNSGTLIDSVPVYMGKMKGATQERPMFIAHETPAYAHTGEKDAVDADGNPVYQQMDASALIPVMWAEIQSLRKRLADAGI